MGISKNVHLASIGWAACFAAAAFGSAIAIGCSASDATTPSSAPSGDDAGDGDGDGSGDTDASTGGDAGTSAKDAGKTDAGKDAGGGGYTCDTASAVASTPLAGNVKGDPFTAGFARLNGAGSNPHFVIFGKAGTCDAPPTIQKGDLFIDFYVDAADVKDGKVLTTANLATMNRSGDSLEYAAQCDRLEIVKAPAAGTPGKIRLRALGPDQNKTGKVEGEVDVQVCP